MLIANEFITFFFCFLRVGSLGLVLRWIKKMPPTMLITLDIPFLCLCSLFMFNGMGLQVTGNAHFGEWFFEM